MNKSNGEPEYTPEERQEKLARMRRASNVFYATAAAIGAHAFIEFTGLVVKYVDACGRADRAGRDFVFSSIHSGKAIPFELHDVVYLGEKLECIYGAALLERAELRDALIHQLFGGQFMLVPVDQETGSIVPGGHAWGEVQRALEENGP